MKLLCFSGLGADERMFSRLNLEHELIHIHWEKPEPNETLQQYANRFKRFIPEGETYGFIGLSFGGIIAQVLAQHFNPQYLILISTLGHSSDIIPYYRLAKFMPSGLPLTSLAKFAPKPLFNFVFGANESSTRQILYETIFESDNDFIEWAIPQAIKFSGIPYKAHHVLQIHGLRDKLISCPDSDNLCKIDGGHLLVYEQAEEVSKLINDFIKKAPAK